jgi:hypothetical protein
VYAQFFHNFAWYIFIRRWILCSHNDWQSCVFINS